MKNLHIVLLLAVLLCAPELQAKKYKFTYGSHQCEVFSLGQAQGRKQLVKAWATAGSADKAIEQAKMDAVDAALFSGIAPDASTHGMGTSNLRPLVSEATYREHQDFFDNFFKTGEFLRFVREANSGYPSGENNIKTPQGRRVGINLVLDYPAMQEWLKTNNISKGLGGHFRQ